MTHAYLKSKKTGDSIRTTTCQYGRCFNIIFAVHSLLIQKKALLKFIMSPYYKLKWYFILGRKWILQQSMLLLLDTANLMRRYLLAALCTWSLDGQNWRSLLPEVWKCSEKRQHLKKHWNIFYKKNTFCDRPERLYNVDEKGLSTRHKPPPVVSGHIKSQAVVSVTRMNVTVLDCGNAQGQQIPQCFVFPAFELIKLSFL